MNETIGDRIKARRDSEQLSQQDVATRVDVTPQSVQQWEAGKTAPRGKRLDSLAHALGCSKEWLLFGSGDLPNEPATRFTKVPVLDVELAAGVGAHIDMEEVTDWVPISQDWIFENQLPESNLVVVKVSGDSMLPRLQNGDMLLVNTSDNRPVSGKIYAIANGSELRVKRLIKQMSGAWVISSDNKHDPAYPDEVIPPNSFNQLRIIGRAVKVLMGDL